MKVINISADGKEITDLSQVTVPAENSIYTIMKSLVGSKDGRGSKNS